jgi:DNA-binding transcriptional regulator YiaG
MRLSQSEFGKLINVYPQNVSAWERNTRSPGMKACTKIIQVAKKYGIDIDYNFLLPTI